MHTEEPASCFCLAQLLPTKHALAQQDFAASRSACALSAVLQACNAPHMQHQHSKAKYSHTHRQTLRRLKRGSAMQRLNPRSSFGSVPPSRIALQQLLLDQPHNLTSPRGSGRSSRQAHAQAASPGLTTLSGPQRALALAGSSAPAAAAWGGGGGGGAGGHASAHAKIQPYSCGSCCGGTPSCCCGAPSTGGGRPSTCAAATCCSRAGHGIRALLRKTAMTKLAAAVTGHLQRARIQHSPHCCRACATRRRLRQALNSTGHFGARM